MFQWCASGRRKQLKLFNSRLGHQNKCWQSEILKGLIFRILSRDSAVLMALSGYVTDTSKRAEATALSWRLGWAAFTHALPPWNWTSPRRSCRCEHECQDHLVLPAPSYKVSVMIWWSPCEQRRSTPWEFTVIMLMTFLQIAAAWCFFLLACILISTIFTKTCSISINNETIFIIDASSSSSSCTLYPSAKANRIFPVGSDTDNLFFGHFPQFMWKRLLSIKHKSNKHRISCRQLKIPQMFSVSLLLLHLCLTFSHVKPNFQWSQWRKEERGKQTSKVWTVQLQQKPWIFHSVSQYLAFRHGEVKLLTDGCCRLKCLRTSSQQLVPIIAQLRFPVAVKVCLLS